MSTGIFLFLSDSTTKAQRHKYFFSSTQHFAPLRFGSSNYPTFAPNRGVPCPDLIGTETQAEIIPVESAAHSQSCSFHVPDPGNAGVGKE